MDRRTFLAGGAVALAGCIGVSGSTSTDYDIGMGASYFIIRGEDITALPTLTVSVGETVTWRNTGSRGHTVTAYESALPEGAEYFATGGFDTEQEARDAWFDGGEGTLYADENYEHTFDVPGSYDYFCVPHERGGMIGRIIVE